MDSFVIKAIVNELRTWACPGLIKRIVQTDAFTLWLNIKGKKTGWLIISTKSPYTGLYSTSEKPAKTAFETPFFLALSKHITGGEIIEIIVEELERVIKFEIIPRKAGYRLQKQTLILELIEYNASLFLISANNNRILACSRTSEKKERRFLPGELYKPLPYPSKHNPFKMTPFELKDLLSKRPPNEELSVFLVHNLIGLRPILAEEIIFRAGLSAYNQANTVLQVDKLWNSLQEVFSAYGSLAPHPVVIIHPDSDDLPVLTSFPLKSKIDKWSEKIFSKMNEAAEYFYKRIDQILTFRRFKEDLKNIINRAKKRYKKRLACLEEDLDILQEAERSKYYGDLLMAHLQFIVKGMSEITLPDLYHEGIEVSIPLAPAKNPVQNAQSYFKKYTKAKRGLTIIKERKAETEDLLRKICVAESILGNAKDLNTLSEIEDLLNMLLPEREVIKRTDITSRSITPYSLKKGKTLTGIKFFKIEGTTWDILVGKTDKANDRLTRDLAKPEDIWFHVHDAPGSHVVLKNPGRLENIPFDIIKKAASIAAFFSRQRDEEKVLVGYTRKKHVRKPKGMKPGQVLVDRQKTLLVKPTLNSVIPKKK